MDPSTGQQELRSACPTYQRREPMDQTPAGDEAVPDLRHPKRGFLRRDPKVESQRQGQAVADHVTIDGRNRGLGNLLDPGKDLTSCPADLLRITYLAPVLQIATGAKDAVNSTGEHERPNARIGVCFSNDVAQLIQCLSVERVDRGTHQSDEGH